MAEKIEVKLYKYDPHSMRNKSFTNMMSYVTWFGSHIRFTLTPLKIFSRMARQIKGKLHTNVPQALGVQVCYGLIAWFGSHIGLKKNIK